MCYFSCRTLQDVTFLRMLCKPNQKSMSVLDMSKCIFQSRRTALWIFQQVEHAVDSVATAMQSMFFSVHTHRPHAASSGAPGVSETLACNCTLCPRSARSSNPPKSINLYVKHCKAFFCWSFVFKYRRCKLAQEHGCTGTHETITQRRDRALRTHHVHLLAGYYAYCLEYHHTSFQFTQIGTSASIAKERFNLNASLKCQRVVSRWLGKFDVSTWHMERELSELRGGLEVGTIIVILKSQW